MKIRRTTAMKLFMLSICFVFSIFSLNAQAQEKIYRAVIDSDGVQRVEITGGSYYYEPDHIIVKVNVPVELTFKKTPGIAPHNILIKAPEAGIIINEDMSVETKTVTFTPVITGKFDIFCDKRFLFFKNHREKGMEGVLEVEE
jgi:plastocyanin domain-containing protein